MWYYGGENDHVEKKSKLRHIKQRQKETTHRKSVKKKVQICCFTNFQLLTCWVLQKTKKKTEKNFLLLYCNVYEAITVLL